MALPYSQIILAMRAIEEYCHSVNVQQPARGIGTLRCHVIDVDDLAVGEAFWSRVTGLPVIGSGWTGRFSYLGQPDPWKHEIILQLARLPKGEEANRSHVDITVDDVDTAISQIESIGGQVKKKPSLYPRPGSFEAQVPLIDWAVMQDPFGNEFCLVSELTNDEIAAVVSAMESGRGLATDRDWRAAARRTPLPPRVDMFETVIGSAEVRTAKPHRRIFEAALTKTGSVRERLWHVGYNPR